MSPAKLDRCVKKLKSKGLSAKYAWPICIKSIKLKLNKNGGRIK